MDLKDIMNQAHNMKKKMKDAQGILEDLSIQGQAAAGLVTVTLNGKYAVKKVHIAPEIFKEDPGVLEDLLIGAFNDGVHRVRQTVKDTMQETTGLPFLDGML